MVYRNESWGKQNPNKINLPENILKKGKNIIAIRLIDNWGSTGDFEKIKDFGIYDQSKKIIGFSDLWKFKTTSYLVNQSFHILKNGTLMFLEVHHHHQGQHNPNLFKPLRWLKFLPLQLNLLHR